ncbi:MAG: cephalosporin hydroxylase family protein [Proteobacteria bacterium]|nr:cephalosporin hydroxylase family protein [Pseudomonadota bacterium]
MKEQGKNVSLNKAARLFNKKSLLSHYSYNFSWLGRPIFQYPQDIVAMQEIIWEVKPDLVIETGVAHGGGLILYASILELIGKGQVLGIDIDIREHNRRAIETHSMFKRISMIEGSSVSEEVVAEVRKVAKGKETVLICLDSNHTHEHVLAELEAYAPLTSSGSYCVVFDTVVEDLPEETSSDRPWNKGNNPKTAVREYLRRLKDEGRKAADGAQLHFEIDKMIENKLLITVAPDGYLKRIS